MLAYYYSRQHANTAALARCVLLKHRTLFNQSHTLTIDALPKIFTEFNFVLPEAKPCLPSNISQWQFSSISN